MRVVIGSSAALVALTRPESKDHARTASVEIAVGSELAARRTVEQHYASGFDDLAQFFVALAENWRGWRGTREWRSLEGELRIDAVHDGHVRLDVQLRGALGSDWLARCEVVVDPGEELVAAAVNLREFAAMYEPEF